MYNWSAKQLPNPILQTVGKINCLIDVPYIQIMQTKKPKQKTPKKPQQNNNNKNQTKKKSKKQKTKKNLLRSWAGTCIFPHTCKLSKIII